MNELVKLPLWKHTLDKMRAGVIVYGQTFTAEYFEDNLKCKRETMQFGLAIAEIRRELEKDGFYLSGRGQKGVQFVILPPSGNADVMKCYQRQAADALRRGVILGTNTRLDTLTDAERRKHESVLERMAIKAVLMNRASAVVATLKRHHPELLKGKDTP